jgi:hypothetical protein
MKRVLRSMWFAAVTLVFAFVGLGLIPRPSFAQIKFSGDLRVRDQYEEKNDNTRNRIRIRFRFGGDAKIVDKVNVGFGLATDNATGDPRSRNQTLDNSFAAKPILIDYAYAKYAPFVWLSATGGKFKNPLWRPMDQLWDSDITPEGVAVQLKRWVEPLDIFFNTGVLSIDEVSSSKNPFLYPFQLGVDWKISHRLKLTAAGVYYLFDNVKGAAKLDSSAGSNTLSSNKLVYDYNTFGGAVELGFMDTFVPYIGLTGDFIYNPDPSDNNIGYVAGISLGHKSTTDKKLWRLKYLYEHLEQDAWLDIFPDSDALGGATNVAVHKVGAEYGLAKNVWLAGTYYHSEKIEGSTTKENLVQLDINFKF